MRKSACVRGWVDGGGGGGGGVCVCVCVCERERERERGMWERGGGGGGRAQNSHPSDCPGQADFRSDNRKRSHHLPFGQVDFEYSYW